jgi:glycosyltransferase involved in cell wall biosynthesis
MAGLIVHEWIEKRGGSENVVEEMAKTFPDAAIRCLWNDVPERFASRTVVESWMARTPLRHSKVAAMPLMPMTWALTDVSEMDFVLVSSHLFAHHVGGRMPTNGPRKFVYVHTPARYIWASEFDRRGRNVLARVASPMLKMIDAYRANQGAMFAANSEFIRERINVSWGQDATVIYPPVDVSRIRSVDAWADQLTRADEATLAALPHDFLLGASRFIPYKRLELVIRAGEAAGLPVVLAGSGPQRAELAAVAAAASVPVIIVDRPSDELLYALYQAALVFVFPAVEDFGIMPVEAMSLGTPVLVSSVGGAKESVIALSGGALMESFDSASLKRGIDDALASDMTRAVRDADTAFGAESFSHRLRNWMGPQGVDKPNSNRRHGGTSAPWHSV